MDARQQRTRTELRRAIYELAGATPIDQVSVADVARNAGISRDTFYRWASSPVELLATFLEEELASIHEANANLPETSGSAASVFDEGTKHLLEHVAAHAAMYRNSLTPRMSGALRDGLTAHIERSLTERIRLHPRIAPSVLGASATDSQRAMFVAYAAAGAVGAIEVWLAQPDLSDIESAEATIFASAAQWWLGRSDDAPHEA